MKPRSTAERELKLRVGDGFQLPLIGRRLPSRVFVSTYYDTDDLLLARLGLTLRRRLENGRNTWQLKLPQRERRLELEVPGGPAGPPEELRTLLDGVLRDRTLGRVAELRTRREGCRVDSDGRGAADVVLDSVAVLEGRHVRHRFQELEVEAIGRDSKVLEHVGAALRDAGAADGDPRPKVVQALGLPLDDTAPSPDAPGRTHFASALSVTVRRLLAHDPGIRLGDDPEDVHQAWVATRTLRALLRAARDAVDEGWALGLRTELQWLAGLLGSVRDLDVLIGELEGALTHLDRREASAGRAVVRSFASQRRRAHRTLVTAMNRDRYRSLLDALENEASAPRLSGDFEPSTVAAQEFRRLRRTVAALPPDPSDDELHEVRICGKRARYAAEFAAAVVGRPAERFVRRAKALR